MLCHDTESQEQLHVRTFHSVFACTCIGIWVGENTLRISEWRVFPICHMADREWQIWWGPGRLVTTNYCCMYSECVHTCSSRQGRETNRGSSSPGTTSWECCHRDTVCVHLLRHFLPKCVHTMSCILFSHDYIAAHSCEIFMSIHCICRFDDAGYYYWLLAKSCLHHASKESLGLFTLHSTFIHTLLIKPFNFNFKLYIAKIEQT